MSNTFEKTLIQLNKKIQSNKKQINYYLKELRNKSNDVTEYSKIKIEIKKCSFELNQKYKVIGKYISEKYKNNNISDFTYDDKYKGLIEEIKNLKIYLEDLEKKI